MSQDAQSDSAGADALESPSQSLAEMQLELLADLYDDQLLNATYQKFVQGAVAEGMRELVSGLCARRSDSSDREWRQFVQLGLLHPLRELLHQDPFTLRVYQKPPHQPVDAKALDFIHGLEADEHPPEGTSPMGGEIFRCTTRLPVCDGFRRRARLVAETIDRLAGERPQTTILSVASAHLREINLSLAVQQHRIGRWVAFESDADCLQEVHECYERYGVAAVAGSVRHLLQEGLNLGNFDLIYSTGLFDYLEQPAARRLTERLFDLLRPGGQILISSFAPELSGRGYMECFMDWQLCYRSDRQMLELASALDPERVKDIRVLTEDPHNLLILRVTKK